MSEDDPLQLRHAVVDVGIDRQQRMLALLIETPGHPPIEVVLTPAHAATLGVTLTRVAGLLGMQGDPD